MVMIYLQSYYSFVIVAVLGLLNFAKFININLLKVK